MLIVYILDKTEKYKKTTNTIFNNILKYSRHLLSLSSLNSPTDLGNHIFIYLFSANFLFCSSFMVFPEISILFQDSYTSTNAL